MKKEISVKKLSPKSGDLLVFTVDSSIRKEPEEIMRCAMGLIKGLGSKFNCDCVVVPKGYDLKLLDEKQMRKIGWQRV